MNLEFIKKYLVDACGIESKEDLTCQKAKIWFKKIQLKDKLPTMSEYEQLLVANGMLVKRPLVVNVDIVSVGSAEAEWKGK
jgi:arsenate reductase-like glutaredoxin family protein